MTDQPARTEAWRNEQRSFIRVLSPLVGEGEIFDYFLIANHFTGMSDAMLESEVARLRAIRDARAVVLPTATKFRRPSWT